MATVYLHIGAPKTATSTLQHVLENNYKLMLKNGVLYPRDCRHGNAHHALVCDLVEKHRNETMPDLWYGEIPRGQAWDLLRAEINRHEADIHTVILSSELFFGQVHALSAMLENVITYLAGHEIKIVVYLRRQDQLYSSFYNQDVKGIRHWSQSAYQFYQTHQVFEYGYHAALNIWSETFGRRNILVRPFESSQWPEENIVKDFCHSIGGISIRGTAAENDTSLGMIQLYVKRCLNKIGFDKNLNEEVLEILFIVCPEKPAKGSLYIHRKLYTKYREQWLAENQAISIDYLAGDVLFREPVPEAKALKLYEIDRMGAALYAANMFKIFKSGRYRQYRRLFSKATLLVLAEQNLWNALQAGARAELFEWATASDD